MVQRKNKAEFGNNASKTVPKKIAAVETDIDQDLGCNVYGELEREYISLSVIGADVV